MSEGPNSPPLGTPVVLKGVKSLRDIKVLKYSTDINLYAQFAMIDVQLSIFPAKNFRFRERGTPKTTA